MLDFFAGVPGRLKTLTDRLTSARAGYLDNLNTNLAALPAPAATALSTAQWTNTRAGYLDNIALPVPSTFIQSIQTGWFASGTQSAGTNEDFTYREITLSPAVVVAKCVCFVQPQGGVELTVRVYSTTKLRVSSRDGSASYGARWYVVEFT